MMSGRAQQLPGLAENVEGLQEIVPYGRGGVYTYPASGLGDIVVGVDGLPDNLNETKILAFRNEHAHPRYGDRLVVRRTDNILFGLVRGWPGLFTDITARRSRFSDFRTNHMSLRLDGDTPELPDTPELRIVDEEGIVEFWAGLIGKLREDFSR